MIKQWRNYWRSSHQTGFIILSVFLGLGTAGFVVLFRHGIELIHKIFNEW